MSRTPQSAKYSLPDRTLRTLPGRSFNSLRSRGIRPTLRIIHAYADDAMFDLRYGVRTQRCVELRDLEVVGDHKHQGFGYQPIRPLIFRSAMDFFQIPVDGTFVDYGSGKGRILMLSVLYGFERTVGIEFASDLCVEARLNLAKFRTRTGRTFEAQVLNLDAACYSVNDNDCVFFLYNPFGIQVLKRVLNNIRDSLQSKPRPIHLVYANPVHRRMLDDDPFWLSAGETTTDGIETYVHYKPR